MMEHIAQSEHAGLRLDQFLSQMDPSLSRARWQVLVRNGNVHVNGTPKKPNYTMRDGDRVTATLPSPETIEIQPEDIPLDVLHEDPDIIVLNKPAGLVVHPAPGHASGTLVHALLYHCHDLAGIGGELRPGIVHRLDRDTSGAMVVAKNEQAMTNLSAQFKDRRVRKEYTALVWGTPRPANGTIETLVGRSEHDRKKMSTKPKTGRPAISHYETIERFENISLIRVRIETGRTHQIRVHMSSVGHPLVGDKQYGRARTTRLPTPVKRQMLHAEKLTFSHPSSSAAMTFRAPWPEDLDATVTALRQLSAKDP